MKSDGQQIEVILYPHKITHQDRSAILVAMQELDIIRGTQNTTVYDLISELLEPLRAIHAMTEVLFDSMQQGQTVSASQLVYHFKHVEQLSQQAILRFEAKPMLNWLEAGAGTLPGRALEQLIVSQVDALSSIHGWASLALTVSDQHAYGQHPLEVIRDIATQAARRLQQAHQYRLK